MCTRWGRRLWKLAHRFPQHPPVTCTNDEARLYKDNPGLNLVPSFAIWDPAVGLSTRRRRPAISPGNPRFMHRSDITSHVIVTSDSCLLRGVVCPAWRARTTGRSCGWPSRRSSRWSPSRCSSSRTRPSSVTSAPPALAGLGIAAVILQTVVGLCVFLAYGTTASVARRIGAGDRRRCPAPGIDGVWLAVVIGVVATVAGHRPHRAAGPGVRRRPERGRPGDDVPADRVPRDHGRC